ncbi:unnamed protein product, partial [Vitis vinifera]
MMISPSLFSFCLHIVHILLIRLSAATQDLPRSIICNVDGVHPKFLEIGKRKKEHQQNDDDAFTKGVYHIFGKWCGAKATRSYSNFLMITKRN